MKMINSHEATDQNVKINSFYKVYMGNLVNKVGQFQ